MDEREKTKEEKKKTAPKEFLKTHRLFVLEQDGKLDVDLIDQEKDQFLELLLAMPLDERVSFYFQNFESIFVSLYSDDVGYFSFVPWSNEEWEQLEEDLTKLEN
jgi:hypothetical protein